MKIFWEYVVREDCLEGFLELYSSSGRWVQLFKRHPGFLGTELLCDTSNGARYVTIDSWESFLAYAAMRDESRDEYQKLDRLGESLTLAENCLGMLAEGGSSRCGQSEGGN